MPCPSPLDGSSAGRRTTSGDLSISSQGAPPCPAGAQPPSALQPPSQHGHCFEGAFLSLPGLEQRLLHTQRPAKGISPPAISTYPVSQKHPIQHPSPTKTGRGDSSVPGRHNSDCFQMTACAGHPFCPGWGFNKQQGELLAQKHGKHTCITR